MPVLFHLAGVNLQYDSIPTATPHLESGGPILGEMDMVATPGEQAFLQDGGQELLHCAVIEKLRWVSLPQIQVHGHRVTLGGSDLGAVGGEGEALFVVLANHSLEFAPGTRQRYCSKPNVILADLFNEPCGPCRISPRALAPPLPSGWKDWATVG